MPYLPMPLSRKMLQYTILLVLLMIAFPIVKSFPTTASDSLVVSGVFTTYANEKSKHLVRIKQADGSKFGTDYISTLLPPFDSGKGAHAGSIHVLESSEDESRFLIGGNLVKYNGTPVGRIALLDMTGKLDASFAAGTGFNATVQVIKRDPWNPDKYYVGGEFTEYDGLPAPGLARINSDGSMDMDFAGVGVQLVTYDDIDEEFISNPGRVTTIAFHKSMGLVCFGGSFNYFNEWPHNNIACIKKAGLSPIAEVFDVIDPFVNSLGFFELPPGADDFSATSAYVDEVDKIKIDEANDKIYISGQFNTYANRDASGQFTPADAKSTGNLCRLNIDGTFDQSYPYEGILAKRMDFLFDEPNNAVVIGAGKYDADGNGIGEMTAYASLIKFDRDSKALLSEFAVTEDILNSSPVPYYDGGVHSKEMRHGTGEWSDYIYLLQGNGKSEANGDGYSDYGLSKQPPLIRINLLTGEVDPTFPFGPIDAKEAAAFIVLKESDYGLFDWSIDLIFEYFGIDPETFFE
ncbi:MAG: delta-60 repeat domain-containing protein [Halieaceae bacterium]